MSPYLDRAMEMDRGALAAWLEALRADQPALASDLEQLLGDRDTIGREGFLDEAVLASPATSPGAGVTTWGPLQLLEKVGEGGFAETYRAHDIRLDRDVALKLLRPRPSLSTDIAGRIIREGALLARVRHPNVVTVHGAEQHMGRIGLWMELIRGRTLEDLLEEQGPLGEREAVLVGLDLCRALAAVHRAGIVHGDIKARNVMRENGGRIVLMDFGAGVEVGGAGTGEPWAPTGTPLYLAPELLRGLLAPDDDQGGDARTAFASGRSPRPTATDRSPRSPTATGRSDLYSLGVLLFHLVTREYPVAARTLQELIEAHARGEIHRLRDQRGDLSTEFVRAVEWCLARDPADRVETAGILESALIDVLGETRHARKRSASDRSARAPSRRVGRVSPGAPRTIPSAPAAPADWASWRRRRVEEWSLSHDRLDREFVALTLLLDAEERSTAGRWSAKPERYHDLREVLLAAEDPVLVLLGPPGCGKSTLLRRLEMDLAQDALAETAQAGDALAQDAGQQDAPRRGALAQDARQEPLRPRETATFFFPLNHYRPLSPAGAHGSSGTRTPRRSARSADSRRPEAGGASGEPGSVRRHADAPVPAAYPEPGAWLEEQWSARYPEMPALSSVLAETRVVLLLDGLNEIPTSGASDLREAVLQWKRFIDRIAAEKARHRVIFSCRSIDYSAPLSTPSLRVPQVQVEPMTDALVEQYLRKHDPVRGGSIWSQLAGTPQLETMRSPYFLSLLVDQVEATGELPRGRAVLFTRFVRQALRREVERDHPLFAPDLLLTERDVRRIVQGRWGTPWDLPERGALIPRLAALAFGMQDRSAGGGTSQVRVPYDEALVLVDHERSKEIVRAGAALSVLDEDAAHDDVLFTHQLVQEYFAARRLALEFEPERAVVPWQAIEIAPSVAELLRSLPAAETLPTLPSTGWEETVLLAGEMSHDPDALVRGLMGTNLPLAGRCAAQPDVLARLSPELLAELRGALASRSRDRAADLRARIDAGLALGPLGDSRLERRRGPQGDYLAPLLAEVPAGRYPMGEDEPFEYFGDTWTDHMPRHEVAIAAFRIARFPVTNAEWKLFIDSGAYEEERWWETEGARRWQSGEATAEGARHHVFYWLARFQKHPNEVEERLAAGNWTGEIYERWKKRLAMSAAELEEHLEELYPSGKLLEPAYWRHPSWNNPSQPVVGVSWFEARAYASWLSDQTGHPYRLPTEAEWEAAARGPEARPYAYGSVFDALRGNTGETRIHGTTPVGVFIEGDTPQGVSDLTGNVEEWTSSLFGSIEDDEPPMFGYPYGSDDGREDPAAASGVARVVRGGSWSGERMRVLAADRHNYHPGARSTAIGFRLVASTTPSRPSV